MRFMHPEGVIGRVGEAAAWSVGADVLSCLLLSLVAYRFLRVSRAKRGSICLLFAAGVALLAWSFPTPAIRASGAGAGGDPWEGLRLVGQTGGALVVLCAYATVRLFGRARPALAVGWALVGLTLAVASFIALSPAGALTPSAGTRLAAHGVMAFTWVGASALAAGRTGGGAVPIAFFAFALGKAAWMGLDLGAGEWVVPWIYAARLVGIFALLFAIRPPSSVRRVDHAAA